MVKWTFEKLKNEALKYKSKKEFVKNSNWAYKVAIKLGVLDQICSHMNVLWEEKWHFDSILEVALKCSSRKQFYNNHPSAYNAARRLKILGEVCKHMSILQRHPYTFHELKNIALKYEHRIEFMKRDYNAYSAAIRSGRIDEICAHMEFLKEKWSMEKIIKLAKTCKNIAEFYHKYKKAYNAACRLNFLDELKEVLPYTNFAWNTEKLEREALKYKTKYEFSRNNPYAYRLALELKILDKICKHMPTKSSNSVAELELLESIRVLYPNAKKLRDRKIKIKDKPHIKHLELDIFVPELNLGIEYDGRYYHSYDGLRRGHPTWSDDDIKNYHEIKNAWFATKGIKILHIKEEDWIKDKQACIDKCLIFLSSGILS